MKQLRYFVAMFVFAVGIAAPVLSIASPMTTSAACPEQRFLGMPPWFRGLQDENKCDTLTAPSDATGGIGGYIWKIVLNVVEIGLFIVGYIALFFVLYGGFQFLTGGSDASRTAKARTTILNAVIGLVISFAAIGIINLLFGVING